MGTARWPESNNAPEALCHIPGLVVLQVFDQDPAVTVDDRLRLALKVQIAGLSTGYDRVVVRQDEARGSSRCSTTAAGGSSPPKR